MSELTKDEQDELNRLARQCLTINRHDRVEFPWFVISKVGGEQENRLWIHKYGATIFTDDATGRYSNDFYVAEALCILNLLRKIMVLDQVADA